LNDYDLLVRSSREKCLAALALVHSSVKKLPPFDISRKYTHDELEPYDALSDRFIRAVEVSIRFFRSYEIYQQAEAPETFRDLMHRMEKYGLIQSAMLWIEMRDVRNRIVHDYIPEKRKEMFDLLLGKYSKELVHLARKLENIRP